MVTGTVVSAVQSADGRPRRDLVAPGRLDGERGDDTAKGAQPAVDLADIVQQRRSKYLGRDVVRQRSLHRTRNLYGMPAIGIGQALPQSEFAGRENCVHPLHVASRRTAGT